VAHLGVLRRLIATGIPIDVLVGVSAGAIIAGFYAGVGLHVEEMIGDAPTFKGRHLFMHGLQLRSPEAFRPFLRRFCGIIPTRLGQLDQGRFDRLHYGVERLGIVCHDVVSNQPLYFSTGDHHGVPLSAAVKGSAAVPGLIPTRPAVHAGRRVQLVDGGVSDSLPWQFARDRLGATHLIVSDCRRVPASAPADSNIVYIRPALDGAPVLRSPAGTLIRAVEIGEAAWTRDIADRILEWREDP
jgi:predicted acylesterase/phospholipase RssA